MTRDESLSQLINRIIYSSAIRFVREGDLVEAERYLALTPDPRPAEHTLLLGKVLAQQGKYREAIAEWQKVLAADPGNRDAADAVTTAEGLLRNPAAHPAQVFRRRLVCAGQITLLVALVASVFVNVRQAHVARGLEAELGAARQEVLLAQSGLQADQSLSQTITGRLNADSRMAGFAIDVRCDGGNASCSGDVPSLYVKELIGVAVRSVGGVRLADVTAIRVTHSYTTRPGDYLSSVAERVYGDASRWRDVYSANKDRIADPDILDPSTVLRIP
jgi:nucleoid-associated protein YgaU